MPTPTFVGSYNTAFNTATSPKSSSAFDVALGDVIASIMADEAAQTSENYTWGNSGTGLTWVEQTQATFVTSADVFIQAAHATPAGAQTSITGTLTRNTGNAAHWFGAVFARWSNATMTGVVAGARSTTPDTASPYTLSITPVLNNSAIFYGIADFSASDFTSRVHSTVNGFTPTVGNGLELAYFRDSAHYSACWAYIPDAGAGGAAKTVGITGPAGGDTLLVAVEIGGVAAAATRTPAKVYNRAALNRAYYL